MSNVAALLGGLTAWEQAGYPVDSEATVVAPVPTPTPAASVTPATGPLADATRSTGPLVSSADIPRIAAQELKAKLDDGQAVIFDARRQSAYARKHIAGAISLPQDEVVARLAELPTDKLAVFYCT